MTAWASAGKAANCSGLIGDCDMPEMSLILAFALRPIFQSAHSDP